MDPGRSPGFEPAWNVKRSVSGGDMGLSRDLYINQG
jgi:hypothetical protein